MHTEQNAPFLQLFIHKQPLPHPLPQTPPPSMNLFGPIFYKFPPPWVTWCFTGWFKWGFKEYWKVRWSHLTKPPETTWTPLRTPFPGGGGTGLKPPKNLPTLEDHLHAKFHQDPSSGLDFYRELTQTLPPLPPTPWGAQIKSEKTSVS